MEHDLTLEDVAHRATIIARSRHVTWPHLEPLIDDIVASYAEAIDRGGLDHLNDWLIGQIKRETSALTRRLRAVI